LRLSASDGGLSNRTDAYFGFQTTKTPGGTVFDRSTIDLLRPRGGIADDMFAAAVAGTTERSAMFTLDDISGSTGIWVSGSHSASSLTYVNGAVAGVLDAGYDRFSVPMYGGFDGVDIMDMDAFANQNIVGTDELASYTLNTFRRAIDTIADPETVEMSLAAVPGLTNEGLTTHLINTCEDRADALAIIDLPGAFTPREEAAAVNRNNTASNIRSLINGLRSRGLNSSYGCTYYPWVRARDTINGAFLWLPPTIPALGTLSSSQRKTQVWFAPAGFNRGGLTEGSAGIPVVDVAHQLRRKDRDDLYSANINPIAKFPAEGIVIFGQKTLQVTPSALDRINVRRLMIFIKKRISQIAAGLLFDPNVKQTWLRFLAQVNPFLADVKTNFGLSAFKVVLDSTTTTPDLIDRNILYAQIFLKPTRAIEFIAIDFNISRTGASFED
jgi:phage tail sheath protein FI